MSFFKEVEQAITEKAIDETQRRHWIELANKHFDGVLMLLELPASLGALIVEVEEMYQQFLQGSIESEVYHG